MRTLAHYPIITLAYCTAIFFACGCNTFYNTASPYVPVFEEKKTLYVESSVGSTGVNVAASYTPLKYVYVGGTMHAMSGDNHQHLSGGPHIGYYSMGDSLENIHQNVQFGMNFGNSHYGNLTDTGFVSGISDHVSFYGQLFIGGDFGHDKPFFFGGGVMFTSVKLDYRFMRYTAIDPGPFDTQAGIGCVFLVYQRKMIRNPNLRFTITGGYQRALPSVKGGAYVYMPILLRFGVCYQFHLK